MRICFSHSSVEGIIFWGFMQNQMWRNDAYLIDSSGNLSVRGQRYEALMNEWTTKDTNYTDTDGNVSFRGFHGSYEITLSAPGQTPEVHAIELPPGTTQLQFILATNLHSPVPEFNAPTPNPLVWATAPAAIGASTITMTAATAADETPPVQYYFECTNHGEANSTWQTSSTYIAQGLTPSTLYSFRVKARDSASSHNETGWSNTLSATTWPPGTTVELAGSWLAGTTHAKENGFNRALIFIAHGEHPNSNMNLTSVTYGGQPMTKIIELNVGTGYRAYVVAYILKEAGIAAATSSTFTPTWSDSSGAYGYASVFLQNVDQTTSIGATASNSTNSGTDPISTSALVTDDGDMVILGATCNNLGSYTLGGGFTEGAGTDQQFGDSTTGGTGVSGFKAATGASETPSADYSSTVGRQVIIGFVVKAYEAPPAYSNCSDVIAAGYRLPADISGSGDCYVNYEDLATFVQYWLNTDCVSSGNCHGADFVPTDGTVDFLDFSDLAEEWMQCNNPQDANCTYNWQ
jgi:hypothetical protein